MFAAILRASSRVGSVYGHSPSGFIFEINVIGHKSTLLAVPTRRSIRRHHCGSIENLPAVSDDANAPMLIASGVIIIAADDHGFRIDDKAIAILRDNAATPIGVGRHYHTVATRNASRAMRVIRDSHCSTVPNRPFGRAASPPWMPRRLPSAFNWLARQTIATPDGYITVATKKPF